MEIRHLKYFLSVAEELNFGRAAEKMHISQPPLSRQIMDLEEELGAKLFERTSKGVELTPAGRYLRHEAARLVSMSELIKDRVATIGRESSHHIRIAFVGSVLYSFIPELVRFLRNEMPSLSLELKELPSAEQAKALAAGKIDVGFVRSWLSEAGVRFVPVAEEMLSVALGRELPGLAAGAASLDCLASLPFIAFSDNCAPGLADLAEHICLRAGFTPQTVFVANQYDAVLRFVAAGLGWTIAPTMAVKNSTLESDLVSFELSDLPERIVVGMALRDGEDNPLILELADSVRRYFLQRGKVSRIARLSDAERNL
jgi:DNA-binding transcriptional LysR family regulator